MATKAEAAAETLIEGTKIKWDDSNMKSAYANVCNVSSTREEVVLLFGVNQAWNRGQKEVVIQLTDRIIVSPFAAKRLSMLLGARGWGPGRLRAHRAGRDRHHRHHRRPVPHRRRPHAQ